MTDIGKELYELYEKLDRYAKEIKEKDAEIIHVRTQLKEETNKNIAFLKEVDLKNREIAELEQSYDVTYADCENRLVDMRKEISGLEKENEKLLQENENFMDSNDILEKLQLANAENETLGRAIAEIDKLIKSSIIFCEVCGEKLTMQSSAEPRWGCSSNEIDTDNPNNTRQKKDRHIADKHYSQSVREIPYARFESEESYVEQLNELKSALLAMKKETKTG